MLTSMSSYHVVRGLSCIECLPLGSCRGFAWLVGPGEASLAERKPKLIGDTMHV